MPGTIMDSELFSFFQLLRDYTKQHGLITSQGETGLQKRRELRYPLILNIESKENLL
jgi:hypothetical protein